MLGERKDTRPNYIKYRGVIMNLFEINDEITKLIETSVDAETGEIDEQALAKIDELQLAKTEKIENIGLYILSAKAYVNAVKEQIKVFKAKQESAEKKIEELEKYLARNVDTKFETEKVKISFRKSESLEIVDEDELNKWLETHPECQKIEIKTTPIKAEIKKAIEQGEDVRGVVLKINNNVQVK